MGWKSGNGLGKNQQGTSTNLKAVRREDGLGIGATTDTFGADGFSQTSKSFHGVLASLQVEHGDANSRKKSEKKKKKRKKEDDTSDEGEIIHRGKREKEDFDTLQTKKKRKTNEKKLVKSESMTLAQNRVNAGHARKMRDAKNLNNKCKEDMAAIFGMKVEAYQATSVWARLSTLGESSSSSSLDDSKHLDKVVKSETLNIEEKSEKKKKKKEKKELKQKNDISESSKLPEVSTVESKRDSKINDSKGEESSEKNGKKSKSKKQRREEGENTTKKTKQ